MTYALSYLTLAGAFAAVAVIAPSWYIRGPAIIAGSTFVVVALAYFLKWPWILGKSATGGRWPWGWLFTGPYLILSEISFRLSGTKAERTPVKLNDAIVLGPRLHEDQAQGAVRQFQLNSVLDMAAEFTAPQAFRNLPHYKSVAVLDATAPDAARFADAVSWLVNQATIGRVYVHCAHGHGRSVMVVAGYLIATKQAEDAKAAIAKLKTIRPKAKLSPDQWRILQEFARGVKG